ncbi:hypothetical protein KIW84_042836 [Lathyrus oleraceus]|uniref:Uncharacterized protein n=1 Tax=Pisum sativum TaxID=3888 RepID=A0A9D4XDJ4_PEA|nr:hypothetical protein KIW84_042836 [Pisum sativum]
MRSLHDQEFAEFLIRIGDGVEPTKPYDMVRLPLHIAISWEALQLILQGTDLKGTKAQLTTDPIQKKAQTGMLARRANPSLQRSPSEAYDISEFSGFILSPLGHHNHYKYRYFSHETKTDEDGQKPWPRNPGDQLREFRVKKP